jgi:Encapsulating protein for peroxidase
MRTTVDQDEMTGLARAQADKLRVVRRAIKPVIGHAYVDSVLGHKTNPAKEMSIRPNQHLQPLQISRHFMLYREQSSDFETLKSLITRCAADLALAEDAVILLGNRKETIPLLDKLYITYDPNELKGLKGLWQGKDVDKDRSILDSILHARKTLQGKSQYGEYYVIVSPELYQEAYKPRATPTDAPIYQILPLLAKDGFLYSDALESKENSDALESKENSDAVEPKENSDALNPKRRGVMFSLAQGTISLSVPMDIWVDSSLPNDQEGRPRYKVGEQFRLVIDDTRARVDLL